MDRAQKLGSKDASTGEIAILILPQAVKEIKSEPEP